MGAHRLGHRVCRRAARPLVAGAGLCPHRAAGRRAEPALAARLEPGHAVVRRVVGLGRLVVLRPRRAAAPAGDGAGDLCLLRRLDAAAGLAARHLPGLRGPESGADHRAHRAAGWARRSGPDGGGGADPADDGAARPQLPRHLRRAGRAESPGPGARGAAARRDGRGRSRAARPSWPTARRRSFSPPPATTCASRCMRWACSPRRCGRRPTTTRRCT